MRTSHSSTRRVACPTLPGALLGAGALLAACQSRGSETDSASGDGATGRTHPAVTVASPSPCRDDGGLTLPPGFCATIFADSIGHARHLAVSSDGAVYVNTWSGRYYGDDRTPPGGFLVALRDTNRDGRADAIARFGDSVQSGGHGGTGIALYADALYAEANDRILRFPLPAGSFVPAGKPDVIVDRLPQSGDHPMHPFAIDSTGGLFVNLGSATNACQIRNRIPLSPGHRPCAELATRGGIWRYDANRRGQHFSSRERFATGIRNSGGIAVDSTGRRIYATQHGRDQLYENWPRLYSAVQGQNFPAEVLLLVEKGADYGWPECYFDSAQVKLVLAPEYGGDGGTVVGPCASKRAPIAWFPAHWAPNDLLLYHGRHLPARYGGGAFVAFHGSWNRAPGPQGGYNVVFVSFADGRPTGTWEVFADGFAGGHEDPGQAAHRPSGLALGPDGALYIADDKAGRIWRVAYHPGGGAVVARGEPPVERATAASANGGASPPAGAESPGPPEGTHPDAGADPAGVVSRAPAPSAAARAAGITPAMLALGDSVYHGQVAGGTCAGCHGTDAKGTPLAPDLTANRWLWGDGSYRSIVETIRRGVPAPKQHSGVMPPMGGANLTPAQVNAVGAYVYALSHPGGH